MWVEKVGRGESYEAFNRGGMRHLEDSGLTFLLNFVTINVGILSDILSYLYPHLHSVLMKLLLWVNFSFLLNRPSASIM